LLTSSRVRAHSGREEGCGVLPPRGDAHQ
jgi:hypothetical protein